MAQTNQILPDHLYPHFKVVVNDNSEYNMELASDSDDSVKMMFVFVSPKGDDTGFKTITGGLSEFVETYGVGPFAMYGQPYLNAYAAFRSGYIHGHCLRVTAPNAAYATSHLVALYKIEGNAMTVKFKSRVNEDPLTDVDALPGSYTAKGTIADGEDAGYTEVLLMSVAASGKGVYGDGISYAISSNTAEDKNNEYKNYVFSVSEATSQKVESFYVTFAEDAIVDDECITADSVICDINNGSNRIKFVMYQEGFNALFKAYHDANPDTELTEDDFDALLGINKYTKGAIENYTIDNSDDTVTLNLGVTLEGGSDGDFSAMTAAETRKAAIEKAYNDAWAGKVDEMIFSKNMYPTNLILDADYPVESKQAIAALVARRRDCMCVLDCGTGIKTKQSPITYVKNNLDAYATDYVQMIDAICGKVRDPYSKKLVTVTDTYVLASNLPSFWVLNGGKHVPYAGNTYGTLDAFEAGTIYPVYDEDVHSEIMDELCEERINFARLNSTREVIRATQTTRQDKTTALSEANNVFIVLDIRRDAQELCDTIDFNFSEEEDRSRFNNALDTIRQKYSNAQVKSIAARFDANDYETVRNILHLYIELVHKGLVKHVICEIDVNKPTSNS